MVMMAMLVMQRGMCVKDIVSCERLLEEKLKWNEDVIKLHSL